MKINRNLSFLFIISLLLVYSIFQAPNTLGDAKPNKIDTINGNSTLPCNCSDQGDYADNWAVAYSQDIHYITAQSFTPSEPSVGHVELKMFYNNTPALNAAIILWLANGSYPYGNTMYTGSPLPSASNILGVTSRSVDALPVGFDNASWISFDFTIPIAVTPGTQYWLVATTNASIYSVWWLGSQNNPYIYGFRPNGTGQYSPNDQLFRTCSKSVDYLFDSGDQNGSWALTGSQSDYYIASQSFTPTTTNIGRIQLNMYANDTTATNTSITLWLANQSYPYWLTLGNGSPLPTSSNIIGMTSRSGLAVPMGIANADWVSFDFANPVLVTPGIQYWIIVKTNATVYTTAALNAIWWQGTDYNPYNFGFRPNSTGQLSSRDMAFRSFEYANGASFDQGDKNNNWQLSGEQSNFDASAQSFISTASTVTRIQLRMFANDTTATNTTINLWLANSSYNYPLVSGVSPVPTSSSIIGETARSGIAVPMGIANADWVSFDFLNAISVTPGNTYWIIVNTNATVFLNSSLNAVWWSFSDVNPYSYGFKPTINTVSVRDGDFRVFSSTANNIFDQGDVNGNWYMNYAQGIFYASAQSFTATATTISEVQLNMFANDTIAINTTINLWLANSSYPYASTTSYSAPVPDSHSIIGVTSRSGIAVPMTDWEASWISFDFNLPIQVTPGSQYWIIAKTNTTSYSVSAANSIYWIGAQNNPYNGGFVPNATGQWSPDDNDFRVFYNSICVETPTNPSSNSSTTTTGTSGTNSYSITNTSITSNSSFVTSNSVTTNSTTNQVTSKTQTISSPDFFFWFVFVTFLPVVLVRRYRGKK